MKKTVLIFVLAAAVISTACGAVFMMLSSPSEEIRMYLNEFMWNIKSGVLSKNIFINSLRDNLLTLAAIFICGFFKPGMLISLFVTARKCFVSAFTVSAFMYYYTLNGFFSAAVLSSPFMILFTSLIIMCSASVSLSLEKDKYTLLRPYILFSAVCAITFIAAALTEGYIVPPLLKLILQ